MMSAEKYLLFGQAVSLNGSVSGLLDTGRLFAGSLPSYISRQKFENKRITWEEIPHSALLSG
jgi:hypothetical protein